MGARSGGGAVTEQVQTKALKKNFLGKRFEELEEFWI